MKTALVTTTINMPKVLALYREHAVSIGGPGPIKAFFVALDKKSPLAGIQTWTGAADIFWLRADAPCAWKCSELIGWNTDSRRNIALLEALKWGADIIISVDDDMIPLQQPLGPTVFAQFEHILSQPFSGLHLGLRDLWGDVGQLTLPAARQRGLPTDEATINLYDFVHNVDVGAAQGIILGVPDTDASTTVANRPLVHSVTDILRHGLVGHPQACMVFNSQFTAFRRELAPAFFQHYATQQRNTDIYASLIMRRLMRDRDLYTHYGPPFGFHNRSPRDPIKDMQAELWGLQNIVPFAQQLDDLQLPGGSAIDDTRFVYDNCDCLAATRETANAFLDDCEGVM